MALYTHYPRWSETYDRGVTDWLDIQQDVAFQVARALEVRLSPRDSRWLARSADVDQKAARLHEHAKRIWQDRSGGPQEAAYAQKLLEQALSIEPDYYPALADLGRSHVLMVSVFGHDPDGSIRSAREVLDRMQRAGYGDTADYHLIDAVASRHEMSAYGVTSERLRHIDAAYARAISLSSNDVTVYLSAAIHARRLGHLDRAAELLGHAIELDPLDVGVNLQFARVYSATGRGEEAIRRGERLVAHYPDLPLAYATIGELLASLGRFDEALDWLHRAPISEGDNYVMFRLRATYHAIGDRDRAIEWIERSGITPMEEALIVGLEDDWAGAFEQLNRLARNSPSLAGWQYEWVGDAAFLTGAFEQARYYYESSAPELVAPDGSAITQLNYRRALKLAAALRETGEGERATDLLARLDGWLEGHHRLGFEGHATTYAESLVVEGRTDEAVAELMDLFADGWIQLHGPWSNDWFGQNSPLLERLAGRPDYRELRSTAERNLEAMRERIAQSMRGRPPASAAFRPPPGRQIRGRRSDPRYGTAVSAHGP